MGEFPRLSDFFLTRQYRSITSHNSDELNLRILSPGLIGFLAQVIVLGSPAVSKAVAWQPALGHTQIPIWPGRAPDEQPVPGPEISDQSDVTNITKPTMTVYSPTKGNTGAAVVVIPGGGFRVLAIDLEGTEMCDWLITKGVTCKLLKYRVPSLPYVWQCDCRPHNQVISRLSLEDVQRTLRLTRAHAAQWAINPHKIGVLGSSAGGYLVAEISTHFQSLYYVPVDVVDQESARPDFAIALYPGHLSVSENSIELNPEIQDYISSQTPPTFLLQNEDDHTDRIEDALSYYMGLKKLGVPVELHAYAAGGHGFGLRAIALPVSDWPLLVEKWLTTIGIFSKIRSPLP